jgi:hypothetical protein
MEVYDNSYPKQKIVDTTGNMNSSKSSCDKRVIELANTERIVGMNFGMKEERMTFFIALIWNML